jgi:hypothetical protein
MAKNNFGYLKPFIPLYEKRLHEIDITAHIKDINDFFKVQNKHIALLYLQHTCGKTAVEVTNNLKQKFKNDSTVYNLKNVLANGGILLYLNKNNTNDNKSNMMIEKYHLEDNRCRVERMTNGTGDTPPTCIYNWISCMYDTQLLDTHEIVQIPDRANYEAMCLWIVIQQCIPIHTEKGLLDIANEQFYDETYIPTMRAMIQFYMSKTDTLNQMKIDTPTQHPSQNHDSGHTFTFIRNYVSFILMPDNCSPITLISLKKQMSDLQSEHS